MTVAGRNDNDDVDDVKRIIPRAAIAIFLFIKLQLIVVVVVVRVVVDV